MIEKTRTPSFHVVSGKMVHDNIFADIHRIVDLVEATYRKHAAGHTINPDSYFLRFPDHAQNRIIALPAHIGGGEGEEVSGLKWISSFPGNISRGLPRASAVLILNDPNTGFPLACLEASVISAARTAASAVLAALWLNGHQRRAKRVGLIGAGLIGRYIIEFLLATGWTFEALHVHDIAEASSKAFCARFASAFPSGVHRQDDPTDVMRDCDVIVFTTTASTPHIFDRSDLEHNPLILHISLRDLDPDIILSSHNVVDDIDHCLKASTSTHLAYQRAGGHDFIQYTLPGILNGVPAPDRNRPVIFSPFGMGILDLAVGLHVFQSAIRTGEAMAVDDFYFDLTRV